ncbi:hypothetical protein V502_05233 [Pseudogymnoascus sp. VKM F-4520 (FW-2644)]|nr:hypothetical protein V502_05233 [Pseudogymnoascus sp. VKM F-4520 (FW-2644)]
MQGLGFTAGYFPEGWFANENVEPETHYLEAESMRSQHRPERVQWLGVQIARLAEEWMRYSGVDGYTFSVGEKAKECFDAEEGESGSEGGSGSEYGEEGSEHGSKARSESGTLTMEVDDRPASEEGDGRRLSFLDMRDAGITSGGLEQGGSIGDVATGYHDEDGEEGAKGGHMLLLPFVELESEVERAIKGRGEKEIGRREQENWGTRERATERWGDGRNEGKKGQGGEGTEIGRSEGSKR